MSIGKMCRISIGPALLALVLASATAAKAEPQDTETSASQQREAVEKALEDYILGTSFSDPERIRAAFSPTALLLLERENEPLWEVPVAEYAQWFEGREPGQATGRVGEIMDIDIDGEIATAKVEILMPQRGRRYVDLFLLKRFDDRWLIISKTADSAASNRTGERVLLVVSDAPFHGNSRLPAGVSFEEAFRSYEVFRREGYTVDIVSPGGGPVPLAYVETSDAEHRSYVYNSDFMSKLENTFAPADVDPSRYRAIQFIGGSNAMYGVTDNAEIQAIAMAIHDDHGGVISAVCHGTAGLMALKTRSGSPFIKGRKITGFPQEYERPGAPYLAQFPFMMNAAARERGAEFSFGPRGESYVVADDRLITGQNPASSEALAEAVVKRLKG